MDRCALTELSLADRSDGKELIDTKHAFDGQPTPTLPSMPLAYNMVIILLTNCAVKLYLVNGSMRARRTKLSRQRSR